MLKEKARGDIFVVGEAMVNYLDALGIRTKMRPMKRAPFYAAWPEKKLRGPFVTGSGASGSAATRIEAFISSTGAYAYGGYPDIAEVFQRQAVERDRAKREGLLHRIQQLTVGRVMFAPIDDFRALHGGGSPGRRAHHQCDPPASIPVLRGHATERAITEDQKLMGWCAAIRLARLA